MAFPYVSRIQAQDGTLVSQQEARNWYILSQESDMAATQIEIQIPITVVAEETTFTATGYFRTRSTKAEAIPTTIHYRVDCLTTGRQITAWTSVTPLAQTANIVITAAQNQILSDGNKRETKQITIKLDSGLATQIIKSKQWIVSNLQGIT